MKSSPLQVVRDRFGDKEKLLAEVQQLAKEDLWLDRLNPVKSFARVSNRKLLKLHEALVKAKEQFGSRDKLVKAILELEKRVKDAGYKARLASYPLPRLIDLHRTATRRKKAKDATPAPVAAAKKKNKARSKKAKAKAAKSAPKR